MASVHIGKNIRVLRLAHNETQLELGRRIGVEENTIGMYETGKRQPDMQKLQAIATHYGFPVDRLVSEELSDLDFNMHTLTWEKYISVFKTQFPDHLHCIQQRESAVSPGLYVDSRHLAQAGKRTGSDLSAVYRRCYGGFCWRI